MSDCSGFISVWKIVSVNNYDEKIGDRIQIEEQPLIGKFAVRCLDDPENHHYSDAICNDGVLVGDDGYTIELITAVPRNMIHFTSEGGKGESGSWTAEDTRTP